MNAGFFQLSELHSRPQEWLWDKRFPRGAISLLEGLPGCSKSTLTYYIAACLTSGRPLYGTDQAHPPGDVIILQAEDNLHSTVKPALQAAGADLTRVIAFDNVQPFLFPDDLPRLEAIARGRNVKLLTVDPAPDFLKGSANSDQSVRKALKPLAAFASRTGVAVLLVRHLRKTTSGSPLHHGMGSVAMIGIARCAWVVGSNPKNDDKHEHVLASVKSNLASAPSLLYRTLKHSNETITIDWLGEVDHTATDLAKAQSTQNEQSALREALYVLYSVLENGPVAAKQVVAAATAAQVARRTLYRAKDILGVRSRKHGGGSGSYWTWELPDQIDPQWLRYLKDRDMDDLCDRLFHGPVDITNSLPKNDIDRNPFRDDDDDAPAWACN